MKTFEFEKKLKEWKREDCDLIWACANAPKAHRWWAHILTETGFALHLESRFICIWHLAAVEKKKSSTSVCTRVAPSTGNEWNGWPSKVHWTSRVIKWLVNGISLVCKWQWAAVYATALCVIGWPVFPSTHTHTHTHTHTQRNTDVWAT